MYLWHADPTGRVGQGLAGHAAGDAAARRKIVTTIQQQIESTQAAFARLSASRRAALAREARECVRTTPHMADASMFWRGLSARQVIAAANATRRLS